MPKSGGGRRLAFGFMDMREDEDADADTDADEKSKVDLTAVAGIGGKEKVCLCAGADGGSKRAVGREERGCTSTTLQGEV